MEPALGMILPFITAILWGFHALLAKKGMETGAVGGLEGGFFSLCSGALFTGAYLTIDRPTISLTPRSLLNLAIAGILNFALGTIAYFQAIDISGVSRATVLSSVRPFFAAIFAILLLGEQMTEWIVFGTILIVLGISTITGLRGFLKKNDGKMFKLKGDALALLASLFFGLNPIFIKKGMEGFENPFFGVFIAMASGAFAYFPFLLIRRKGFRHIGLARGTSALFLGLAGIASASANFAYYSALRLVPVTVVLPISNIYPFVAAGLSILILNERITIGFLIGSFMIFIGVFLVTI
ncbi:DMT family transporter [Candidatus Bathyarchaeota archaeon]|nr:DMT family transporter [Candidatus Bathyarchaeota archaeon]